jgi:glycosyltransferase involved in cell wall biosynthesis
MGHYNRVSIALATYNGEKFLVNQLNSISNQYRQPDEIIICDDCSTDRTIDILTDFARRSTFDVVIFRNDTNLGYEANFFKAMSYCTGDVIALCDQDDVWHPKKLERCVQELENDPRLLFVAHNFEVVNSRLEKITHKYASLALSRINPPASIPPLTLFLGQSIVATAKLVNIVRTAYGAKSYNEIVPSNFIVGHDTYLSVVGASIGYSKYIGTKLSFYRRHETNTVFKMGDLDLGTETKHFTNYYANAYDNYAKLLQCWINILEFLQSIFIEESEIRAAILKSQLRYRHLKEAYNNRAVLYDSFNSHPTQLFYLLKNVFNGDYSKRKNAGLGYKSLVKDAYNICNCSPPKQ